MMQVGRAVRILLASQAVDFRKSFDGLCGVVRGALACDPVDGTWYVFYNRRRDRVKLLVWDGDGFWLHYKRLEAGTFEVPFVGCRGDRVVLSRLELELLLGGIELASVRRRRRFVISEERT